MKQDSAWKDILEDLFPEFLQFYFPEIYTDLDFEKGFEFLDNELQKVIKSARTGKRIVDKLVKVWLKSGEEKWLLIHIEIQSTAHKGLAHRMFVYNYRLVDKYKKDVVSLIVLSDANKNFREKEYFVQHWGFSCHYIFPMVKLFDYKDKWDVLEKSTNPFAKVTQAFLKTIETKRNQQARYEWKYRFLVNLYKSGLNKSQILAVYRFIDWIMDLPKELDERIFTEVLKIEENKSMPYISTAERIGLDKGKQIGLDKGKQIGLDQGKEIGLHEGLHNGIYNILYIRFQDAGASLYEQVKPLKDISLLQKLQQDILALTTLAEVKDYITKLSASFK